ncbi:MAG TPA: hypothetical protein VMS64_34030 [Candidatus Methylomirabilis sp.]|nr:hypothetical protein [Candidatus Methylomirabilis sp.]
MAGRLLSKADLVLGAGLLLRLPALVRHPLSLDESRQTVRRRLEGRATDFLSLMRAAVYAWPSSAYRRLLALAGCDYGDLERLVRAEGVEGALRQIQRAGVYLTVDELKGHVAIRRGSAILRTKSGNLLNPLVTWELAGRSGGSGGAASTVPIGIDFIRDRAADTSLVLDARGGRQWVHAIWGVPGGAAVVRLLEFAAFGAPPAHWFSQIDPGAPGLHARYRWSARLIRWTSRLAGVPLPPPRHVPINDPQPIVAWMSAVLATGRTPHLHTFASSAVRVCRAARAAGVSLLGARFTMASEPITSARLAAVRAAGAEAAPCYASMECGPIGYGCLAPRSADDLHLLDDLHAVIPAEESSGDPPVPAGSLLISSLRPTAPTLLLNVSLGDQGVLDAVACGCPLERIGWTRHLHSIRSFRRVTVGGMTVSDASVIRVLEDILPARFGGGPTDYQLLEEDTAEGEPRLSLLVHPAVGPIDARRVADTFLAAIGHGSSAERVMELQWRQTDWLRVERRFPVETSSGKILHLDRTEARKSRD